MIKKTIAIVTLFVTLAAGIGTPIAASAASGSYGRLYGHAQTTWTWNAGAGIRTVVVEGDGDTDLDLYVYNSQGVLLGRDTDYTDLCVVSWFQAEGGTVRIVIKNRGSVYNDYVLTVE